MMAGNLHGSEVEAPRNDARYGVFLKGNGAGHFMALPTRIVHTRRGQAYVREKGYIDCYQ